MGQIKDEKLEKANIDTTDRQKGINLKSYQLFCCLVCDSIPFVHTLVFVALIVHTRHVNINSLHYKLTLTSTGRSSPQIQCSGNRDSTSESWSSDDFNNLCIKFRSGVILCRIGTQY